MRVPIAAVPDLQQRFAERVTRALSQADEPDQAGWHTIELPFDSLDDARWHLLAFGGAVEVLSPTALRESIHDYARQITSVYD